MNNSHKQSLTLVIASISLTTLLILTGYAYSLWSEQIMVNSTVKIGDLSVEIEDCPLVAFICSNVSANNTCACCCHHKCRHSGVDVVLGIDGQSVEVYAYNVTNGDYIWVLMMLKNNGTLPLKVNNISIVSNCTLSDTKVYVYGPYHEFQNPCAMLSHVNGCNLPFPNKYFLPIVLDPSERTLVLVRIVPYIDGDHDIWLRISAEISLWNN